MDGDQAMIVAGLGCRRLCPAGEIVDLVRAAESRTGRVVDVLAAPAFKDEEPGLQAAAHSLGLRLVFIDQAALDDVQDRCPTPSQAAHKAIGLASVAEACALACAGPAGILLLPKIASARATCALAGDLP
jgi:cobalt-precorrin 5A hydrolase